jgi:ABC-type sugar transport system substrate-binding protein
MSIRAESGHSIRDRRRANRIGVALVAAVVVAGLAACAPQKSKADSAGGGVADKAVIDKYLLTPAGAVGFESKPGPVEKGPITGAPLSLPYKDVLPLPDGPVGDPNKTYRFCFSQALIRHPWSVAQKESIMLEAARHANVKVDYYNTDNDPLKQVQDIDTCMAQKVDAILVWPHSVGPLTPEIEKAKKAGFTVVGMERTVATGQYDNWIYLDYKTATKQLAEAVGKQLGSKGVVAETSGAIGSSAQILRHEGFASALKEQFPDVKLVTTPPTDFSRAQGYKVALDFLQSPDGKKVDAWYVHSGEIAIGIRKAMQELRRTNIPIYTIDGSKPEAQDVQSGQFKAVAPWTPLHADIALRAALYRILGKDVPKNISLSQPPLITSENAADQLTKAWGQAENK